MAGGSDDSTRDILSRFNSIDDGVALEDSEVAEVLKGAGIDPDAALGRLMARVTADEQARKEARYADAARGRMASLAQLDAPLVQRSRAELVTALRKFDSSSARAQAMYKNLRSVSDSDLASLVQELEFLAGSDDGEA